VSFGGKRVLTVGYPSLDHIARVDRLGGRGETRIVKELWPSPTQGGCAANVAVALARVGVSVATCFAVGDDVESQSYVAELQRAGVDVSHVEVRPGQLMPQSYLFLDDRDSELYFDPGAMRDWKGPDSLDLSGTERLVATVGPVEVNLAVIELAEQRGIPIALQLKRDLIAFGPDRVRSLLAHCDLVFANQGEFEYLLSALKARDVEDVFVLGPHWVVETRGPAGAVVHHPAGSVEVPVVAPERVVEPTGAGDAFTAGVVFALLEGAEPVVAARIGAVVASFAVEGWGCQAALPTLPALRQRYHLAFGSGADVAWLEREAT
jgi:sugar/nucleoside kinase (ribokinase family)